MKIAVIIPPFTILPAKGHGGTERIAEGMINEFLKIGHEVSLIGCGDCKTDANFIQIFPEVIAGRDFGIVEASRPLRVETAYMAKVMHHLVEHDGYYDVIFNHTRGGYLFLPIAQYLKTPIISTFHLPLFEEIIEVLKDYKQTNYVTVSDNQQKPAEGKVNFAGTVYNGINPEEFDFSEKEGDYLLFIGAMGEHKVPHLAIEAAKKAGEKIIIAGGKAREPYFTEKIKPHLDDNQVQYIGEVGGRQKADLYKNAKALLFPVAIEEAFGLVIIESMVSGTPVIAFDRGAVREIITDNIDGYIVNNVEEMAEKIKQISKIDRNKCREKVMNKFTYQKMAQRYLDLYKKIEEINE